MSAPRVLAVIPARYASIRFPGKPLADILGKPMIQHVWERVQETPGIQQAVIATDDERILAAAQAFGATVQMTSPDHPSGTDRLWEVAQHHPDTAWIMNIQGDEPFISPSHLQGAIDAIQAFPTADIITLVTPLHHLGEWQDPNLVKAVMAADGRALYFSRAPIPFHRDVPETPAHVFRHLGLYLYRASALQAFTQLPPSRLEGIEKLEQLRALEAGMSIYAVVVAEAPIGVDTPDDLIRILDSVRSGFPS
jgi:3-deoxy-D-manno-octulosonate cytidylyltransferase